MNLKSRDGAGELLAHWQTVEQVCQPPSKSIGILYLHTFPFTELRICECWMVKNIKHNRQNPSPSSPVREFFFFYGVFLLVGTAMWGGIALQKRPCWPRWMAWCLVKLVEPRYDISATLCLNHPRKNDRFPQKVHKKLTGAAFFIRNIISFLTIWFVIHWFEVGILYISPFNRNLVVLCGGMGIYIVERAVAFEGTGTFLPPALSWGQTEVELRFFVSEMRWVYNKLYTRSCNFKLFNC